MDSTMTEFMTWKEFIHDLMARNSFESYRRLADDLDVSTSTISNTVKDKNPTDPGLTLLSKISLKYGIPVDILMAIAFPGQFTTDTLSPSGKLLAQEIDELDDTIRKFVIDSIRRRKP